MFENHEQWEEDASFESRIRRPFMKLKGSGRVQVRKVLVGWNAVGMF